MKCRALTIGVVSPLALLIAESRHTGRKNMSIAPHPTLLATTKTAQLIAAAAIGSAFHLGLIAAIIWYQPSENDADATVLVVRLIPPPSGVNANESQTSFTASPQIPLDEPVEADDFRPAIESIPARANPTHSPPPPDRPVEFERLASTQTFPAVSRSKLQMEPPAASGLPPVVNTHRHEHDANNPRLSKLETEIPPRREPVTIAVTEPVQVTIPPEPPSVPSPASQEQRGVQTDTLPAKSFYPAPLYPPNLEARRIGGLVKLRVSVSAAGRVVAASVSQSSGYQEFDRAALDVIKRWQFKPARRDNATVQMDIVVPIRFRIDDQR